MLIFDLTNRFQFIQPMTMRRQGFANRFRNRRNSLQHRMDKGGMGGLVPGTHVPRCLLQHPLCRCGWTAGSSGFDLYQDESGKKYIGKRELHNAVADFPDPLIEVR